MYLSYVVCLALGLCCLLLSCFAFASVATFVHAVAADDELVRPTQTAQSAAREVVSHHTVGRVWGRTWGSRRRAQLTPKVVMAKRFAPLRPTHSRCMTASRCANVLAGGARSSWRQACVLGGEANLVLCILLHGDLPRVLKRTQPPLC